MSEPKYAIYDEAVGALTFLEGNSGVSFSGRLKNNTTIDLPDDCILKKLISLVTDGVEPPAINARDPPL